MSHRIIGLFTTDDAEAVDPAYRHAEVREILRRAFEREPDDREATMHLGALEAEAEAPRL